MFGICCVNWMKVSIETVNRVNVVEGNRRHVRDTSQDSGLGKGRGFHIERPFLIINNWSTFITVIRRGVEVQYL